MPSIKDMTGKRFGRLVVLKLCGKDKRGAIWECCCDCGVTKRIHGIDLRRKHSLSCGCLSREQAKNRMTKHGGSYDRLYLIWQEMKKRCIDSRSPQYHNYGMRGIKVCDEWLYNYKAFKDFMLSHGYDPSAPKGQCTIDRIDNNGDYCPENCRVVNMAIQNNNKRNNYVIEFNGELKNITEWSKITGINRTTIFCRLRDGWSVEEALTIPTQPRYYKVGKEIYTTKEWSHVLGVPYNTFRKRLRKSDYRIEILVNEYRGKRQNSSQN